MTYRQSHAASHRNSTYRPSNQIAAHILNATLVDEVAAGYGESVSYRLAAEAFTVGNLIIAAMQAYWLVASKFTGRFYVVTRQDGIYVSSAKDERVAAANIMLVVQWHVKNDRERMTEAEHEAMLIDSLAYDLGGDPCLVAKFRAVA